MKAALQETTNVGRMATLCLALVAAVLLPLAAFADTTEAKKKKKANRVEKIVFASDRPRARG